ncbi:MAG TPA: hypothetical protein ENF36_01885 [Desulfobacteraceae bacterium]|nr:hypothetical protein [Desulfobacteraceae bacterium]
MKKLIILLICLFLFSCAPKTKITKEKVPPPLIIPPKSAPQIPVQTIKKPILKKKVEIAPLYGKLLSKVEISTPFFNPTMGEEVGIYYTLSKDAKVEVNIYDPDSGLIRTMVSKEFVKAGENAVIWDGKDMDGNVVPDEAYFFTIIAKDEKGHKEIYDPTTFSGGEEHDITQAQINPQSGTINYRLPEMGRVNIRLGISGGPLLMTLVDWEPRLAGEVTEYWNGKDKDNLINLREHPRFKMIITYFTLPQNSVIAYGNKNFDYLTYKETLAQGRPLKEKRGRIDPDVKLSSHYRLPRILDRSPKLIMSFPKTNTFDKQGIPLLTGKTLVHVELDEKDKRFFQDMQFEICFFLDGDFYAEEEAGYSPYNWVWDTSQVKEGEHILTVNLSSFKGQIGVLSRKVKVVHQE